MFREFRPFFINRHHIVAFSVHKDRFKSHFSQGVNQVAATIPRIEGEPDSFGYLFRSLQRRTPLP